MLDDCHWEPQQCFTVRLEGLDELEEQDGESLRLSGFGSRSWSQCQRVGCGQFDEDLAGCVPHLIQMVIRRIAFPAKGEQRAWPGNCPRALRGDEPLQVLVMALEPLRASALAFREPPWPRLGRGADSPPPYEK